MFETYSHYYIADLWQLVCGVVLQSLRLNLTEREMEREHQKQITRRKAPKDKHKDSRKAKHKS